MHYLLIFAALLYYIRYYTQIEYQISDYRFNTYRNNAREVVIQRDAFINLTFGIWDCRYNIRCNFERYVHVDPTKYLDSLKLLYQPNHYGAFIPHFENYTYIILRRLMHYNNKDYFWVQISNTVV